jgi:hypothetical protein
MIRQEYLSVNCSGSEAARHHASGCWRVSSRSRVTSCSIGVRIRPFELWRVPACDFKLPCEPVDQNKCPAPAL